MVSKFFSKCLWKLSSFMSVDYLLGLVRGMMDFVRVVGELESEMNSISKYFLS